jgi:hypothetical protein
MFFVANVLYVCRSKMSMSMQFLEEKIDPAMLVLEKKIDTGAVWQELAAMVAIDPRYPNKKTARMTTGGNAKAIRRAEDHKARNAKLASKGIFPRTTRSQTLHCRNDLAPDSVG